MPLILPIVLTSRATRLLEYPIACGVSHDSLDRLARLQCLDKVVEIAWDLERVLAKTEADVKH
jgi:hypothetical protein